MEETRLTLANAITFFCKAMVEGWAGDCKKKTDPTRPGCKWIEFAEGDFRLRDEYYVTPGSDKSSGTTTIWFEGQPVWIMHYQGEYPKEAIPMVKEALARAYAREEFNGGRGTKVLDNNRLIYINNVDKSDFRDFSGQEQVFDNTINTEIGYHRYFGMALVEM